MGEEGGGDGLSATGGGPLSHLFSPMAVSVSQLVPNRRVPSAVQDWVKQVHGPNKLTAVKESKKNIVLSLEAF